MVSEQNSTHTYVDRIYNANPKTITQKIEERKWQTKTERERNSHSEIDLKQKI